MWMFSGIFSFSISDKEGSLRIFVIWVMRCMKMSAARITPTEIEIVISVKIVSRKVARSVNLSDQGELIIILKNSLASLIFQATMIKIAAKQASGMRET